MLFRKSLYTTLAASLISAGMLYTGSALAALTVPEVERLGKDLTPTGAERAASKDGAIPSWDGGLARAPANVDAANVYADPYAHEKPLYTISAANLVQYHDKLAPGQVELLKRFPTYKINVYASHRTTAMPQQQYDYVKAEAGKAALLEGGNGLANVSKSSVPFPIPKSGLEVIMNHLTRYRGGSLNRISSTFPVQVNGAFTPVERSELISWASAMEKPEPNRLFYYRALLTAPSSVAGESLLAHESLDQLKEPRLVWTYNPGSRRVLRAPEVAYDSPQIGGDGLATIDDYDAYNGAPDRYDWKLVGKKEMIISYNNYRMLGKDVHPSDLVKPGHINQDLVRYELHRVWVVEATLKPGKRHIYSKRMFYIDEDSWQVAHADEYDGRGELWRIKEVEAVQFYDAPAPWFACELMYDLQARRYLVQALVNARRPIKFNVKTDVNLFSVDNLRRFSN